MPKTNTKADLTRKVEELETALKDKAGFENSAAKAEGSTVSTMVPVKNFGGTSVSIEYDYKGMTKVLILDTEGPKQVGAIPLDVWIELEHSSKLISDGYIARTDLPYTNPNVIPDIPGYITGSESDFAEKISDITNHHVLHKLLRYIEGLETKTGKMLAAASALKDAIFKISGVRIVEEEE